MSINKYGTPFVESEALLALQCEDFAHAYRLISQMLPQERYELAVAAERLADACRGES